MKYYTENNQFYFERNKSEAMSNKIRIIKIKIMELIRN